jgi:Cu/Ag efflux protein CusF
MIRKALLAAVIALAAPALGQRAPEHDDGHGHIPEPFDPANPELVEGEVRLVDRPSGSVTLSHAPIPSRVMPAATTAFQAMNPAMLEGLKPGDRVRFVVDYLNGVLVLRRIDRAATLPAQPPAR